MSEPRIWLAVGAAALALLVAAWARGAERRRTAAGPLELSGLPVGLVLFSDSGCERCGQVRAALQASGAHFVEVAFDREPVRFQATGVRGVPLLVARDSSGNEVGRIAGRLTRRALNRLLTRL